MAFTSQQRNYLKSRSVFVFTLCNNTAEVRLEFSPWARSYDFHSLTKVRAWGGVVVKALRY
jgi:hypothetical protein